MPRVWVHWVVVGLLLVDFGCVNRENKMTVGDMHDSEAGAVGVIAAFLTGLTLARCGKASTDTIASNTDAITKEPSTDATAYDYAITSAATSVRTLSLTYSTRRK